MNISWLTAAKTANSSLFLSKINSKLTYCSATNVYITYQFSPFDLIKPYSTFSNLGNLSTGVVYNNSSCKDKHFQCSILDESIISLTQRTKIGNNYYYNYKGFATNTGATYDAISNKYQYYDTSKLTKIVLADIILVYSAEKMELLGLNNTVISLKIYDLDPLNLLSIADEKGHLSFQAKIKEKLINREGNSSFSTNPVSFMN